MVTIPLSKLAEAGALTGDEITIISQLSTSVTISGTTISADGDDNSFNDSGSGFVAAGFAVDDYVHVTGFTGDVANNIFSGKITALTAGKMTIGGSDGDVIVDDAAGESVAISKWESARINLDDLPGGGGGGGAYETAPTIPTTSGFTLQNAGTASMADSAFGIALTVPSAASTIPFVRKNGSPPATPYDVIMRGRPVDAKQSNGLYKCALIMRNSSNGRLVIFSDYDDNSILVQVFSSYTTHAGDVLSPGSTSWHKLLPWKRIENDGTNLKFYIGPDGENWFQVASTTLAAYLTAAGGSVDEIGFGMLTNSPGVTAKTVFNSFTAA